MGGRRFVWIVLSIWVVSANWSWAQQPQSSTQPAANAALEIPPAAVLPFTALPPAARVPGFDVPLGPPPRETLEQRFDKRVYDRARESLRDRDRNRNDVLDGEELKRDWDPPILECDLDQDCVIDL